MSGVEEFSICFITISTKKKNFTHIPSVSEKKKNKKLLTETGYTKKQRKIEREEKGKYSLLMWFSFAQLLDSSFFRRYNPSSNLVGFGYIWDIWWVSDTFGIFGGFRIQLGYMVMWSMG